MNKLTQGDRPSDAMAADHRLVHQDFRLVERDRTTGRPPDVAADLSLTAVRDALRLAWSPPRDTFVTGDMPILLTRLDLTPDGNAARSGTTDQGVDGKDRPLG